MYVPAPDKSTSPLGVHVALVGVAFAPAVSWKSPFATIDCSSHDDVIAVPPLLPNAAMNTKIMMMERTACTAMVPRYAPQYLPPDRPSAFAFLARLAAENAAHAPNSTVNPITPPTPGASAAAVADDSGAPGAPYGCCG